MPWYVITREHDNIEGRSSALLSEAAALDFACGLINEGIEVLRIEGETEVSGEEVAAHCAERRTAQANPRLVG